MGSSSWMGRSLLRSVQRWVRQRRRRGRNDVQYLRAWERAGAVLGHYVCVVIDRCLVGADTADRTLVQWFHTSFSSLLFTVWRVGEIRVGGAA